MSKKDKIKAESSEKTEKRKPKGFADLKSTATRSVEPNTGKASKKTAGLDTLQPPEKTGTAAVGLDMGEIRNCVKACVLSISSSSSLDMDNEASGTEVMLAFKDDVCTVTYARFGAFARRRCRAKSFKDGAFVVPSTVFNLIRGNSPYLFMIADKDNSVHFRCGSARGSIPVTNTVADFKERIPKTKLSVELEIPRVVFLDLATKVMFPSFDPALPAAGLPISLHSKSKSLLMTSNDNLVGAMFSTRVKGLPEFKAVVPGEAVIRIAKNTQAEILRCGFSDSEFRIVSDDLEVYHQAASYDIFDFDSWLREEESEKPEFELDLSPVELIDALDSAMALAQLDKSEPKVTLEFDDNLKARALFSGNSGSSAKAPFRVLKFHKTKKSMVIITDGKRLMNFVSMFKSFAQFRMRVRDGRAICYTEDKSYLFMVPLA